MKTTMIALALLVSGPAFAECHRLTLEGTPEVTNVRTGPGMDFRVKAQLVSRSGDLLWCGHTETNEDTEWRLVSYKPRGERHWHYGFVSSEVTDIAEVENKLDPACPSLNFIEGRSVSTSR